MTCPVEGCTHPAGSACTMSGCPGTVLRRRSPSARKGDGVSSPVPSPAFSAHSHAAHIAQVRA